MTKFQKRILSSIGGVALMTAGLIYHEEILAYAQSAADTIQSWWDRNVNRDRSRTRTGRQLDEVIGPSPSDEEEE